MTETTTLNMGSFATLSSDEMLAVDGGGFWAAAGALAVKAATAVGGICGMGALGGGIVIGCCVVAVGAGIACAVNGIA